jgi:hypothetical protein
VAGIHIIQYRTSDSTEFKGWNKLVLNEGFQFRKSYSGEGKNYWLYRKTTDLLVYTEGVEDGSKIYYLLILKSLL